MTFQEFFELEADMLIKQAEERMKNTVLTQEELEEEERRDKEFRERMMKLVQGLD